MSLHSGITTVETDGRTQTGDLERYVSAMFALDPGMERESWVRVAMAAKASGMGLEDFDRWSSAAGNYDARDCAATWRSISADGPIGPGTLIQMAQQAGWRYEGQRVRLSAAEIAQRDAERVQRREREAAQEAAWHAKAAARAQKIWNEARPANGHAYLVRKRIQAHGLKVGRWERFDRETGEVSVISDEALLVPIRDTAKRIHSLQAIFPSNDNLLGRDRDYLAGGAKEGNFFTIGKLMNVGDKEIIVICTGYATSASVHESTGHAVVVAFDDSNLLAVAKVIRGRYPGADIIIFSDRDAEALSESGGTKAALKAAVATNARLVVPEWTGQKGRDANDIYVGGVTWRGTTYPGKDVLDACVKFATPCRSPAFMSLLHECGITADDLTPQPAAFEFAIAKQADVAPQGDSETTGEHDGYMASPLESGFTVLGGARDAKTIYIFSHSSQQIMDLRGGSIREGDLLALLPDVNWWELNFPKKGGINVKQAIAFLVQRAHARGVFNPDMKRGRGGWTDAGRTVLHLGDRLIVDGVEKPLTKIASKFIYPANFALPSPSDVPLTDDEARRILQIANRFRWKRPASAALLSGWVVLAPLCGALRWRPHVWVTGGAGSGKTSLMTQFVHELVNGGPDGHAGWAQFLNGNSTDAGVRQDLQDDALPVLFDEFEGAEEQDARRVQNMLALARQASSNTAARTVKGTPGGQAMAFRTRSMFAFSSVGVSLKQQADVERISVLELRPKRDRFEAGAWERIVEELATIRRDGYPGRLLRRSINLLPVTLKNIQTFAAVAANRFGSQRDGDQYGTLLAGAWSVHSSVEATAEQARHWIDSFEWDDFVDADEGRANVIDAMFGKAVRLNSGEQILFGALLRRADHRDVEGVLHVTPEAASAVLALYGVRVSGGWMYISNKGTASRSELLKGTYFASPDTLRRALREIPGADNSGNKAVHFPGIGTDKCSRVPLKSILADEEDPAEVNGEEF